MLGIFEGMDGLVDECLGITVLEGAGAPGYRSFASLLALVSSNRDLPQLNLADQLLTQAAKNWLTTSAAHRGRSSSRNWQAAKRLAPALPYVSPTMQLNQAIASATDVHVANRVPVDSGLLGSVGQRKVALAEQFDSGCALIELATTANTPLAMAIQALQNGMANLFIRTSLVETCHPDWITSGLPELLKAASLTLAVLAPRDFYERFQRALPFLAEFEATLNRSLTQSDVCHVTQIPVCFQFEVFPDDFAWGTQMVESSANLPEVASAFATRRRLFAA